MFRPMPSARWKSSNRRVPREAWRMRTAVAETVSKPWRALSLLVRGIRTEGAMAKDIPLENARPADFVFSRHVETALTEIRSRKKAPQEVAEAAE